jgi:hypothetical protein
MSRCRPSPPEPTPDAGQPRALVRAGVLLAGLALPQVVLYGPSLLGPKILLPLDLLAGRNVYRPATPQYRGVVPQDSVQLEQMLVYEPGRRFAASEVRSGRLPLWSPYSLPGLPFAPREALWSFVLGPYTIPPQAARVPPGGGGNGC